MKVGNKVGKSLGPHWHKWHNFKCTVCFHHASRCLDSVLMHELHACAGSSVSRRRQVVSLVDGLSYLSILDLMHVFSRSSICCIDAYRYMDEYS